MQMRYFRHISVPEFSDRELWGKLQSSHPNFTKDYEMLRSKACTLEGCSLQLDFARAFIHGFFSYEGSPLEHRAPHEINYSKAGECFFNYLWLIIDNKELCHKIAKQMQAGFYMEKFPTFITDVPHYSDTKPFDDSQFFKLLDVFFVILKSFRLEKNVTFKHEIPQEMNDRAVLLEFTIESSDDPNTLTGKNQRLASEYYQKAAAEGDIPAMLNIARFPEAIPSIKPQDVCLKAILNRVLRGDAKCAEMIVKAFMIGKMDWDIAIDTKALYVIFPECHFEPMSHIDVTLELSTHYAKKGHPWAIGTLKALVDRSDKTSDLVSFESKKRFQNPENAAFFKQAEQFLSVMTQHLSSFPMKLLNQTASSTSPKHVLSTESSTSKTF